MSDFILSCCSTADLSKEHFLNRDIQYICFHYSLNDVSYLDDLGESMSFDEFYHQMEQGAETKTSQVNVDEFIQYFRQLLKEGKDIIHVSLSSGLSGVINSAHIAKERVLEEYPERQITIIDSLAASSGYGLLMDKLADLRDEGFEYQQVIDWAETHKLDLNHWFFSMDLSFYVKGGRISKTSGFVGNLLNIIPLLNMGQQGELVPYAKIRGKKKVVKTIVEEMSQHANSGLAYADKCYISHSACLEDAKHVAELVEETFPHLKEKVEINSIGTTIGSHTGPNTVALFFWGDKR